MSSSRALHGREAELEEIAGLIDRAHERGGALLVRGQAGIGKSMLMQEAARLAAEQGLRTMQAAGVQAEAPMPFAALHQLLHPLLGDSLPSLPEQHRAAIESAFGIRDAGAPDRFLIALAVLELLSDTAHQQPVLLAVEDAQWIDRPTAELLSFVARRLQTERVLLIIALRDGSEDSFDREALPELQVGPLDDVAAEAILDGLDGDIDPALRATVLREAAGNPLALVELPTARPQGPLGLLDVEPVPMTQKLERAFASRSAQLPDATNVLLLAAASDSTSKVSEVLEATSRVLGSPAGIDVADPAVAAGLLSIEHGQLRFRHPLVRSAIYRTASVSKRLAVHDAYAEVLHDDPDRALWHRATRTLEPDEALAAAFEESAERARRRGALESAMTALEHAARFSENSANAARRTLSAGEMAFELGHTGAVASLLGAAESASLKDAERGRVLRLRELITPQPFSDVRCRRLLESANKIAAAGDRDHALQMLWLCGSRSWWTDPGATSRRLVEHAVSEMAGIDQDARVGSTLAYVAPFNRAQQLLAWMTSAPDRSEADSDALFMYGTASIVTGAWDLASDLLASAAAAVRAQGKLGELPRLLVLQAMVATRRADWETALPAVEEARALGREVRQPVWAAGALAVQALGAAMRGQDHESEELAQTAEREALPLGASLVLAAAQMAKGAAALGAGRPGDALQALGRMFAAGDPSAHWVMRWWALSDLVEAAVHADEHTLARVRLGELERLTASHPMFWLRSGLAHARLLLAEDDDVDRLFARALEQDLRAWPFELARLQLTYGKRLRRMRRVAESRGPLHAACETFDAITAHHWSERAVQELRAAGEGGRVRAFDVLEQLTPQELQIARMASAGMTNREIGSQLYLSHRTVGTHLYRIFPKLGISSRGQLAAALHGYSHAAPEGSLSHATDASVPARG